MASNFPRLPGVRESRVAPGSGLRCSEQILHLASSQTQNVNARPVGGAASAAVTAWTSLTTNGRANPFCGTLVAHIAQASPVSSTIQLRVRGVDQFGQPVTEVTPVVTLSAKTNNYVYLAHCFAYVETVEFRSTGLDIAGDTLSLGTRWDWTRTVDASNAHLFGRNLGIPIMMRLGRTPTDGQREIDPEVVGSANAIHPVGVNFYPDAISDRWVGYAKHFGYVDVLMLNNDTVTIDGKVYTFKSSITTADGDVLIGATAAECAANLRAAIVADAQNAGVRFGANTTPHPTVKLASTSIANYVPLVARTRGAKGNLIALATSSVRFLWALSLSKLDAGFDAPIEVLSATVHDITGIGSAGAITRLGANQFMVGNNEDDWEGPVEKLHILAQSDVSQWAIADNVMVSMVVVSQERRNQ